MPKSVILSQTSRVATLTFGGKQFFELKAGSKFFFDFVLEKNNSFTVFQGGLNFHIMETNAIDWDTEEVLP